MKRLIVSGAICALWLLASCTPGEGTVASCASAFVGSFEGMDAEGNPVSGSMIGRLDAINGRIEVVLKADGAENNSLGEAAVATDGTFMAPFRTITSGSLDLEDCTASGEYDLGFFGRGTWQLELPDTAL